jgi:flagellar hook-basal body complex protein FliE
MDFKLAPLKMPTMVGTGLNTLNPAKANDNKLENSFSGALSTALNAVSASQTDSSRLQREVQMDNPKVSLEETMVSIQKAQIGFQAALHVRNRMVQAYSDIMNMQV